MSWRWIRTDVLIAAHDRQIAEHGGTTGLRDTGLLESALMRPQNRANFDPSVSAADLAASYAFGIVKNHAFVDGNKRTGWLAGRVFLLENGFQLAFDPHEAVTLIEQVAAGDVDEAELAEWFRAGIVA